MRRIVWFVVAAEATLVAALAVALRSGWVPLGVPGEWEWLRVRGSQTASSLVAGLACVALFSGFTAIGYRSLGRATGFRREFCWLISLVVLSIVTQAIVQEAAPEGYGLSKWIIALQNPGSSGYYNVAKKQMSNPRKFLTEYPAWIEKQDALHIGTHPPGLFLAARMTLDLMEAHPLVARWVVDLAPPSVSGAIVALKETQGLPRADAASLVITGLLTLLACASTVVPIYLLARTTLPAPNAWAAASFWPLVPSAILFQPTADTAFPVLSTTALALTAWAGRIGGKRGLILSAISGLVMAGGMVFTLAFLPVGLVVALMILMNAGESWGRRFAMLLATGAGFLAGTLAWWAATSANPFVTWWLNQRNHGRFYIEYPRNYLAWTIENPIELTIALGLPATVWAIIGLRNRRDSSRVAWSTLLVLVILTISGKNLSEVARLWLPLMPSLLVATGSGFARLNSKAWVLAVSVALVGIEVLILESTIQVVYPV